MTSPSETLAASLSSLPTAPPGQLVDYAIGGLIPSVAVFPEDVEGVSQIAALASREGQTILPRGGGTQIALGNLPRKADLVLGLSGLDNLLYHEPADMVASVQAGVTMESFQNQLAKGGQTLPLDAPFPEKATVGGIIATGFTGPSRLAFGGPKDWMIGIRVVQPDGRVTKAGGRVVKNVTGYDLNKLYTGSLGTLGIIVEANFKLAPLPQERVTLVAIFPSLKSAVSAAGVLMSQTNTPQALQVVDQKLAARLSGPALSAGEAATLVRHSGRRSAVRRMVNDTSKLLTQQGSQEVDALTEEAGTRLWQQMINLDWQDNDGPEMVLRITLLPSQIEDLVASFTGQEAVPLYQAISVDEGTGTVKLLFWKDDSAADESSQLLATVQRLREMARGYGAQVVVQRCPVAVKGSIDVWGESIEGLDLMRRIKNQLDPAGILNPGRFAGGI